MGAYWILTVAGATAGQSSVRLAWDASASAGVAGYQLYYGTVSHNYNNVLSAGNTTGATLGGLKTGTTYYIAVRAYDSSGVESDFSNEIAYQVPGSPGSRPSGGGAAYPSVAGSYSGLFYETNQDQVQVWSAGFFQVLLTSRGAYSGHLQIGPTHYSFSGSMDAQGQARNTISRPAAPALQLTFSAGNQPNQMVGTLSDGIWSANLSSSRAVFDARSNPAPFAGRYTLIFPGQMGTPSLPAGDGFGVVRLTSGGQAIFAGKLADGTAVSQSASISEAGAWPLYLLPYSGRGLLLGWLDFAAQPGYDLSGVTTWIKPAVASSRYYPGGFTNQLQVLGSAYVPSASSANAILSLTNGTVAFSGGDLAAPFANPIKMGLSSRVTNLGSNQLNMSFSLSTGTFSGSVSTEATGKPMPFCGVVFQKIEAGYGFVVGADQTGEVLIGQ